MALAFSPVKIYPLEIGLGQLVQILVVVIGLGLTVVQLQRNVQANRVANLLTITKNHRELWTMMMESPELRELLLWSKTPAKVTDLTAEQRFFLNFLLLHMAATHTATRYGVMTRNRNVPADVGELMSLPAVNVFWLAQKKFHTRRFIRFVDKAIEHHGSAPGSGDS